MIRENSVSVIVVAAGEGRRMKSGTRKPWLDLAGTPIVERTVARFAALDFVRRIVLVVHPEDMGRATVLASKVDKLIVTPGGAHRVESVRLGLDLAGKDVDLVAVQDAVRPFVGEDMIRRTCEAALEVGAALPVAPVLATLKAVDPKSSRVRCTVPREGLFEAQTPQVFRVAVICRAYAALRSNDVTDDAQAVELLGEPVAAVEGSRHNIKITTPEDLKLAETILRMEG